MKILPKIKWETLNPFGGTLILPEGFKINFITLKFEKNLELKFREEYFVGLVSHLRNSIFISIFFYAVFGLLDWILIPEMIKSFAIIRFLIIIPLALFIFALSFFEIFKKVAMFGLGFLVFAAGFGILTMIYLSRDYHSSVILTTYYTGLVLVFIFGFNFLKLRFWWATIAGLLIVVGYEILVFALIEIDGTFIIISNFFLISACLMGMFSSYYYDLSVRLNFYHKNLLEIEKQKVENINAELEERVESRTEKLKIASEKAIKSDKLKTMFLTNISHEIRTPMNGIIGFTALLDNDNLSLEKRKSYIDIIRGRGEYLLQILNNLIEISMIESNSMPVNIEKVNLTKSINKLFQFLSGFFTDKDTKLIIESDDFIADLFIKTDQIKLEQIITNLVVNASKYADKGLVKLGFKFENQKLRIYVSDEGPGIPEHFRPFIFSAFAKNENKQAKFNSGTGLGLAISKGLAELMNAELSYTSVIDEGTTFYLDFNEDVIVD